MKFLLPCSVVASLAAGLFAGVAWSGPRAAVPVAAAAQDTAPPQALFDAVLYGKLGKRPTKEALRKRILELADLGDPQSEHFDDELFWLGCMKLFQEEGTVIPGRNRGVQLFGYFELALDSFDGDAWNLIVPGKDRVRGHPLGNLDDDDLRLPKGRYVKYLTRDGMYDDAESIEHFDRWALFVSLGEQALVIYPNEDSESQPWVAWLPGRNVSETWERPILVESSGHPR